MWKSKLGPYADGELSPAESREIHAHLRECASCGAEVLARVEMKHSLRSVAARRFTPSMALRNRVLKQVSHPQRRRVFTLRWAPAAASIAVLIIGWLLFGYYSGRARAANAYSEIADLHVTTLASSTPVDVVSTDRHTVKPWFQGKIPFSFDLPELAGTEFTLVGGSVSYLEHTPGAHLVYQIRKHRISVFIFQEEPLHFAGTGQRVSKGAPFNMQTWNQGGLRYFAIGDANTYDLDALANLFRPKNQ